MGASSELIAETSQISVQLSEAYERGRTDINFFSALALPLTCTTPFPDFYVVAWRMIVSSERPVDSLFRFALGLPRGHAKTTFVKVVIAWMLCYDYASFILIVCASAPLAENLLADISDIMASDNIVTIYGQWEEALAQDAADTKKATYHSRNVILVARGWAAGIRGLNLKNRRPDFIFCDDTQTKANDESPSERTKLLSELVGTIFKALPHRGRRTIVYVGNLYSDECILQQFRNNKSWTSLVTGAILENGTPLWPELVTLEELKESYEHDEALGLAHVWFAEVMNDPQSIHHSLLPLPIPESDLYEIVENDGAFITIDPAGFRLSSDDNVIAGHVKFENRGYTVETNTKLHDPSEIVSEAIAMALRIGATLIAVESVAYQQTLGFWINFFLRQYGISHITIVEVHPHGRTKESRIRQFVQELYKKTWYIQDPATRRALTWQGSMYKIGKKNNKDDIWDACAYVQDVRNDYWHLITPLRSEVFAVDHNKCSVVSCNTPF